MNKLSIVLTTVILTGIMSGCVATISGPIPPPPPPQEEIITVTPYVGAVWVQGDWEWHPRYHRYDWRRGYWHRGRHHDHDDGHDHWERH